MGTSVDVRSTGNLETKSMAELVEIYNSVAPKPIKKFRDKESAVRRTLQALAKNQGKQTNAGGSKASKKAAKKPIKKKSSTGRGRKHFDLKPKRTIREHRPGTKRAIVVQLLSKGATMEKVMAATGWTYRDAYEGVRLLHSQLGYGIQENDSGVIVLTKPKSAK